jgi:hypothetical protein
MTVVATSTDAIGNTYVTGTTSVGYTVTYDDIEVSSADLISVFCAHLLCSLCEFLLINREFRMRPLLRDTQDDRHFEIIII